MKRVLFHFFLLITLTPQSALAQHDSLRIKIKNISQSSKGVVEVAIKNLETGDTLSFNGSLHPPMQSVFKFPIALTVLDVVDKGTLSLVQKVHLSKSDVSTNMYSPMSKKYSAGNVDITIDELLAYMMKESDGIACDILIKLSGGTAAVNNHIHKLGVAGIAIKATEAEMHAAWDTHATIDVQYSDWCEAIEMVHLLELFYQEKCLSKASASYLLSLMETNNTGQNRIRNLLPQSTIVADKTGSSDTDDKGLTPATNDVGIITLPNGNHLAIAIFVTDSKANKKTREGVIAKIAKAAYDEFTGK